MCLPCGHVLPYSYGDADHGARADRVCRPKLMQQSPDQKDNAPDKLETPTTSPIAGSLSPMRNNPAMPTISVFDGIEILMRYDDHPPAHFHVRYSGQFIATVGIDPIRVL